MPNLVNSSVFSSYSMCIDISSPTDNNPLCRNSENSYNYPLTCGSSQPPLEVSENRQPEEFFEVDFAAEGVYDQRALSSPQLLRSLFPIPESSCSVSILSPAPAEVPEEPLTILKIVRPEEDDQDCSICGENMNKISEDIEIDESILGHITNRNKILHCFHSYCIEKWLKIGSSGGRCPICTLRVKV